MCDEVADLEDFDAGDRSDALPPKGGTPNEGTPNERQRARMSGRLFFAWSSAVGGPGHWAELFRREEFGAFVVERQAVGVHAVKPDVVVPPELVLVKSRMAVETPA